MGGKFHTAISLFQIKTSLSITGHNKRGSYYWHNKTKWLGFWVRDIWGSCKSHCWLLSAENLLDFGFCWGLDLSGIGCLVGELDRVLSLTLNTSLLVITCTFGKGCVLERPSSSWEVGGHFFNMDCFPAVGQLICFDWWSENLLEIIQIEMNSTWHSRHCQLWQSREWWGDLRHLEAAGGLWGGGPQSLGESPRGVQSDGPGSWPPAPQVPSTLLWVEAYEEGSHCSHRTWHSADMT